MRKIKFRAWDYGCDPAKKLNVKGKMVFVVHLTWKQEIIDQVNEEMPRWFSPLMQYTGLKDKNGKEIYEGDVIKIHNLKSHWKTSEPPHDWRVLEVKWNEYLWGLTNKTLYLPLSNYDTETMEDYEIEIIGNRYEHSHLLDSTGSDKMS